MKGTFCWSPNCRPQHQQLCTGSMQMYVLPSPPPSNRVHANVCAALNHQQHKGPCKWLCCPPPFTNHHSPVTNLLQSTAHPVSPSGSLCVALPVTKVTNFLFILKKLPKPHTTTTSQLQPPNHQNPSPSPIISFHQGWLSWTPFIFVWSTLTSPGQHCRYVSVPQETGQEACSGPLITQISIQIQTKPFSILHCPLVLPTKP